MNAKPVAARGQKKRAAVALVGVTSSRSTPAPPSRLQFWSQVARLTNYDVDKMALHFGITKRQLERSFRLEMERSPQDWLYEQRIIAARLLLIETGSIKKVSTDLGFKQLSHFCRQFKLYYGMTPSEFLIFRANWDAKCRY